MGSDRLDRATADAIEKAIRERQREQNGPMVCPQCFIRGQFYLADTGPAPRMEVRHAKLSPAARMPHEDITWKCGECRTHAWSSVKLTHEELEAERERRGGLKYDPTSHPEHEVAVDRLEALGYK